MSKEDTRKHFAELCECIWSKLQSTAKIDSKIFANARPVIAQLAMVAWNMSLFHKSFSELKKQVSRFVAENCDGSPDALGAIVDAAELKWHEYRDDKELIANIEVKMGKGKPRVIAYFEGERPEFDGAANPFHDFMNSPEIQERLKHTPPGKLEEEVGKIIAEYNASLPEPPAVFGDKNNAVKPEERDFPITREELDWAYDFTQKQAPQDRKKEILKDLLSIQPFLAPLCENAYQCLLFPMTFSEKQKIPFTADTVPDIILTLAFVYMIDTEPMKFDKKVQRQLKDIAKDVIADFIEDRNKFEETLETFQEPEMYAFLAETLDKYNLPRKDFKEKLILLMMWGFMLEEARTTQHPDKYPDFEDDEPEEEHYDFGRQKILRLFYLHVKLRGFRVSVDLTVPEDTTFEQLHTVLNSVFKRNDDHLYRFECDDGCTAVRDEEDEEVEDGSAVPAGKCYVGHHLERGSKVYYLFDYGDEWEHDITVKKVVFAEPKDCHFKVLKITGEIPKQYPDEDE